MKIFTLFKTGDLCSVDQKGFWEEIRFSRSTNLSLV